jgi:hypothetical protein
MDKLLQENSLHLISFDNLKRHILEQIEKEIEKDDISTVHSKTYQNADFRPVGYRLPLRLDECEAIFY